MKYIPEPGDFFRMGLELYKCSSVKENVVSACPLKLPRATSTFNVPSTFFIWEPVGFYDAIIYTESRTGESVLYKEVVVTNYDSHILIEPKIGPKISLSLHSGLFSRPKKPIEKEEYMVLDYGPMTLKAAEEKAEALANLRQETIYISKIVKVAELVEVKATKVQLKSI